MTASLEDGCSSAASDDAPPVPCARLVGVLAKGVLFHAHSTHHQLLRLGVGAVRVLLNGVAGHVPRPVFDLNVLCSDGAAFECKRDKHDDERNQSHDALPTRLRPSAWFPCLHIGPARPSKKNATGPSTALLKR